MTILIQQLYRGGGYHQHQRQFLQNSFPFLFPRTTVSPLPVTESAGILQVATQCALVLNSRGTFPRGHSSSEVSISKSMSNQLSSFQNIPWFGSVTSLSLLPSYLGFLSLWSLSSGEIFHLCYHLSVIFSITLWYTLNLVTLIIPGRKVSCGYLLVILFKRFIVAQIP